MKTKTLATWAMAALATVACTNNKTMESGIKLENLDTTAYRIRLRNDYEMDKYKTETPMMNIGVSIPIYI